MSLLQRAFKTLGGLGLVVALPAAVFGQTNNSTNSFSPQGGEYAPAGSLLGEQNCSAISLGASGGFLVWQDNITDGTGLGISAIQLNNTFNSSFGSFRVNQNAAGDQENAQVALLHGGGAAFVWQGGVAGSQHIFTRFLSMSNLWITGDIQVNTATNAQVNPAIAVLTNGNVIVVWGSYGQDYTDGLQGVYGQILTPTGAKVGSEFAINQYKPFNQRSPAVATLPNGNFVVTWISEGERQINLVSGNGFDNGAAVTNTGTFAAGQSTVDVYARVFDVTGTQPGNEFLVNTGASICANPSIATASDGSYIIAWSQFDAVTANNSWDVYERPFSIGGVGGASQLVNSQLYGDQYAPKISSAGTDFMVVWTSYGQDGSREGVYGQFLRKDGTHAGGEQRINTTVLNGQKSPCLGSDGSGRFLAVWSSYVGGQYSIDLEAQEYASNLQPLSAPGAPRVLALDSFSLSVSWPAVSGYNVSYYELFIDGSFTPTPVTNTVWGNTTYNPGTTHTFQLAYVVADGRISPSSALVSGTTWGRDQKGYAGFADGLPDDWEALYYGTNTSNWPQQGPLTVLASGVTVGQVFAWGADPTNPSTWLKQTLVNTPEGFFLNWNTVPGGVYQVMTTIDLKAWMPLGLPRFEAGTADSLFLGVASKGYYKIVRNRY